MLYQSLMMCFHVRKLKGAVPLVVFETLAHEREGLRMTKCRYVLMLKQKAMKWNKTREKERPNFIFITDNTTRSWKCVYMDSSYMDGMNNSSNSHNSYWLVPNCWLTICFKHVCLVTAPSLFNTEASLFCSRLSCLLCFSFPSKEKVFLL